MSWWLGAVVVVATLLASTAGGWAITMAVLRLAARSSDAGGVPDPDLATAATVVGAAEAGDGPTGPRARAVLRGGTWIGLLERIAVTGALLAGYPSAIALVVAVKGLGRYPELREHPGSSERFVIGTLTSLLWAAAVGGLGRVLLLG